MTIQQSTLHRACEEQELNKRPNILSIQCLCTVGYYETGSRIFYVIILNAQYVIWWVSQSKQKQKSLVTLWSSVGSFELSSSSLPSLQSASPGLDSFSVNCSRGFYREPNYPKRYPHLLNKQTHWLNPVKTLNKAVSC